LTGRQVDFLLPHGVGIPACDRIEAKAIETALEGSKPTVLAIQSRIGKCGAGNGPIDLATACLSMQQKRIPANRNFEHPLDGCSLSLHTNPIENASIQHALSCSYTYGGQTAAVVLSQYVE